MARTLSVAGRHPWRLLTIFALGAAALMLVATVLAEDFSGNNRLELDGNVANEGTLNPTDWAAICAATSATTGNGYIDEQGTLPDGIAKALCAGDSYLLSSSTFGVDTTYFDSEKDINDISGSLTGAFWECVDANHAQEKTEIYNGYAALGTLPSDDVALFLAFERASNNGTSFQGAWFLKNKTSCEQSGPGRTAFSNGPHAEWRFDTDGFLLNTCDPATGELGGSSPCTGDLLLIVNHATGGDDTEIKGAVWSPDHACVGLDCTTGSKLPAWPLLPLQTFGDPDCVPTSSCVEFDAEGADCQANNGVVPICATSNDPLAFPNATPANACILTPWLPGSRDTTPNVAGCSTGANGPKAPVIDQFQFVEGFVNLTDIFEDPPCFSTVLFEGRTSAEFTATLKDFTLGDLPTCGRIIVHKETDPDNSTRQFAYTTFGGDGLPASFNLTDDGNNVLGCDYNGTISGTANDCGTTGTVVFENITPGQSYTITEIDPSGGTPVFDFERLTCQKLAGDASTTVTPLTPGSTISPTASITMGTLGIVECLYENRQRGSILVRKQDAGGALLPGAGFTFDKNPFTGQVVVPPACTVPKCSIEILDGQSGTNGDQAGGNNGLLCIDNVMFGTYNITETTTPAGYVGGAAQSVTVNTSSNCAARLAAQTITPDATFTNTLGSLLIHKVSAKTGNPFVAGACFTISPDPTTAPPGTGSLVVCDKDATHTGANTAPDTDSATGVVCVTGVKLNTYSITESTVPTGYVLDSITPNNGSVTTTGVITVSNDNTCAQRATAGGAAVVRAVNMPLSEITILFKSLSDGNTTGTGNTKAQIVCQKPGGAVLPANSENNDPDQTPSDYDDFNEVFGNTTTNPVVPGVYTCIIDVDP